MSWRWQRRWTGGLEAVPVDPAGTLQDIGFRPPASIAVPASGDVVLREVAQ